MPDDGPHGSRQENTTASLAWRRASTGLFAAIALALSSVFVVSFIGCTACDDIGCGPPFNWTAMPLGGAELPPGTYHVAVELEGENPVEYVCIRSDEPYEDICTPGPSDVDDDAPFAFVFIESRGFELNAQANPSDDTSCRGPTRVRIRIELEGETLIDARYDDLEYERDDDFRGPGCGYMDRLAPIEAALTLPAPPE